MRSSVEFAHGVHSEQLQADPKFVQNVYGVDLFEIRAAN
jgi:hypothetical protein